MDIVRRNEVLAKLDKVIVASAPSESIRTGEKGQVFLVIDCSASMHGASLREAKAGALEFAKNAYRLGYEVGLVAFGSEARLILDTGRNMGDIARAVEKLKVDGTTNMPAALSLVRRKLLGPGKVENRAAVVVTDGLPDDPWQTLREAAKLKDGNIRIITIGTDDADLSFLKKLSSHKDLANYVSSDRVSSALKTASKMLPGATSGYLDRILGPGQKQSDR